MNHCKSINGKIISKILILTCLCILVLSNASIKIIYEPQGNVIMLYRKIQLDDMSIDEQPIYFLLDFQSKVSNFNPNIKKSIIYLNKHRKHEINISQQPKQLLNEFHFNYTKNSMQIRQKDIQISGIIGIGTHATFFKLLKHQLKHQFIKLYLNPQQKIIQIISEQCKSLRPPFMITVDFKNKQKFKVDHLSNQFKPTKSFIKVLGHLSNPFTVSEQEMNSPSTIVVNSRLRHIELKQFMLPFCNKFSSSRSYECQLKVHSQQQADIGKMLLFFDVSLCQNGIQIQSNLVQKQQTYFILHLLLILVQFLILMIYNYKSKSILILKNLINKRKKY